MTNKPAAIKRTSIRNNLMSAYEAYERREPNSMDKLLELVRKFAYMKLCHLEFDFKGFGTAETVDDWAQDVVINVWQNLEKKTFKTPALFYSWVHKIAFNQATDSFNYLIEEKSTEVPLMVKIRDEHGTDEEDEEENPLIHSQSNNDHSIRIPASVQGIDRTICKLLLTTVREAATGKHRGRNYAEVAWVLSMTEDAVETRIRRMRKNIKAENEREQEQKKKAQADAEYERDNSVRLGLAKLREAKREQKDAATRAEAAD